MTTAAAPLSNSNLLSSFSQQTQDATAAAKAKMADNVNNGNNASSSVATNFTTFLKILTTQLANQNPTDPVDTNQFTQELVQFSGVEQQLKTNSLLQQLITGQTSGSIAANLNYIGNFVEAPSPDNEIVVQGGSSEFGYTISGAAANVSIKIMDGDGKTVATLSGPTASGANYAKWDGKDAGGNQLADGIYSFQIVATDVRGTPLTVSNPLAIAKVTALKSNTDGTMQLICNDLAVSSAQVDAVYQTNSLPTAVALTLPPSS